MKFIKYILDKWLEILFAFFGYFIVLMIFVAFKISAEVIVSSSIIFILVFVSIILIGYIKRKKFYNNLINNVDKLDKKYLVLEMLNEPSFYDGKIFYQVLYDINKSMNENVKDLEISINEFKEYVELWIHEIKLPISSLILMNHNSKVNTDKRYENQIKKIDNYVDQILYFVRSENAEKDYLIKDISLKKIVNSVAMKNKDDLLEKEINFEVKLKDISVLTDAKWLEFIINQIISNSIKYTRENVESFIKISMEETSKYVDLIIFDNGIGIPDKDIRRVFDKTFTGENGRITSKSTGMGLYIVKKLCNKLGHKISIDSKVNEYTKVTISFSKNDFYKIGD